MIKSPAASLILASSLQGHFFEVLTEFNHRSLCPIPEEIIFYSSEVMDKFALSAEYFEMQEGKVREKILGTKILEATTYTREEQRRVYRDVAETALVLCGFFSESLDGKLVDKNYYSQIGKMAYGQLNSIVPRFLDVPSFYHSMATCFESVTTLMGMVAGKSRYQDERHLIFKKVMNDEELSQQEKLVAGILPTTKKVS